MALSITVGYLASFQIYVSTFDVLYCDVFDPAMARPKATDAPGDVYRAAQKCVLQTASLRSFGVGYWDADRSINVGNSCDRRELYALRTASPMMPPS